MENLVLILNQTTLQLVLAYRVDSGPSYIHDMSIPYSPACPLCSDCQPAWFSIATRVPHPLLNNMCVRVWLMDNHMWLDVKQAPHWHQDSRNPTYFSLISPTRTVSCPTKEKKDVLRQFASNYFFGTWFMQFLGCIFMVECPYCELLWITACRVISLWVFLA